MWTQVAVIASALVTVVLVISSVRVGFTFLVAPIVVCESLLLAVAYLLRQVLADEDEAGRTRGARQRHHTAQFPRLSKRDHERAKRQARAQYPRRSAAPSAPASTRPHDRHAA